jgi:hypothetical protein
VLDIARQNLAFDVAEEAHDFLGTLQRFGMNSRSFIA